MSYLLFRSQVPALNFEMVGQSYCVVQALGNAWCTQRGNYVYLFTGNAGVGKPPSADLCQVIELPLVDGSGGSPPRWRARPRRD
jgi:hypothetical protein